MGKLLVIKYKKELGDWRFLLSSPVCVYSVIAPNNFGGAETFGMLFYAEVFGFENELHSEIEKISIMDELPENWTYPEIQPKLIEMAREKGYL